MAKQKNTKSKSFLSFAVIILLAACSFLYSYFTDTSAIPGDSGNFAQMNSTDLRVYYIDVGQADCELIVCGDRSVLIDAGEAETADKVIKFIKDLGIKKLDCVVATHPHADHIGALPYIIDEIGADNIIMPNLTEENIPATRVYEALLAAVASSGAKVYAAQRYDSYKYGDIEFTLYAPVSESEKELNNMSVVLRLVYGENSFLFTGDAESKVERVLLSENIILKSDVIKVGHHGSKTSSSKDFVYAVSPKYAICCCGDGSQSHPASEITERWQSAGAEFFRTDFSGTIVVISDGSNLTVQTEKES